MDLLKFAEVHGLEITDLIVTTGTSCPDVVSVRFSKPVNGRNGHTTAFMQSKVAKLNERFHVGEALEQAYVETPLHCYKISEVLPTVIALVYTLNLPLLEK